MYFTCLNIYCRNLEQILPGRPFAIGSQRDVRFEVHRKQDSDEYAARFEQGLFERDGHYLYR